MLTQGDQIELAKLQQGTSRLRMVDRSEGLEGDERGHGGRGREQRRLAACVASSCEHDPDRDHDRDLEDGGEVGGEAGAASAQRLRAVRRDGCERAHAEVLRSHEHRRAEALDL